MLTWAWRIASRRRADMATAKSVSTLDWLCVPRTHSVVAPPAEQIRSGQQSRLQHQRLQRAPQFAVDGKIVMQELHEKLGGRRRAVYDPLTACIAVACSRA